MGPMYLTTISTAMNILVLILESFLHFCTVLVLVLKY